MESIESGSGSPGPGPDDVENNQHDTKGNNQQDTKGSDETRRVDNDHYDEELLVVDSENVPSRAGYSSVGMDADQEPGELQTSQEQERRRRVGESERPAYEGGQLDAGGYAELDTIQVGQGTPPRPPLDTRGALQGRTQMVGLQDEGDGQTAQNSEDQEGDSDDIEEASEDDQGDNIQLYDPLEFEDLPVTPEVKDLFKHISQYKPATIEIPTKLRPFIPDYLPAVGDIDGFVKVERPDGEKETLGITVLDEPCARQSDPTVLDLQLRRLTKEKTTKEATVHSIGEGVKNTKAITNWIENISELHRQKPAPSVHYTGSMPDIESLMQQMPSDYEQALKKYGLPPAELDCDTSTYSDICCGLLDIPVHKSRVEALHTMFHLYSEIKKSRLMARVEAIERQHTGSYTPAPGFYDDSAYLRPRSSIPPHSTASPSSNGSPSIQRKGMDDKEMAKWLQKKVSFQTP